MGEKKVTLIRKQSTEFVVNYPSDGRLKKYVWNGTKGKRIEEKSVPIEVYDWLTTHTTTFQEGALIVKQTDDEEINEIKENIEALDKVEEAILTKDEVKKILTTGNHLTLKKKLKELIENQSEGVVENQKRYVVSVAAEIGLDSNAKRKVICEWAGLNYENSDLIFDKELKEMYEKE